MPQVKSRFEDAHDFVFPNTETDTKTKTKTKTEEAPDISLSYVDFLRTKRIEFYNQCHTTEGANGGQFCSDNIDLSKVSDKRIAKRLQATSDAISKVHSLPKGFPGVSVTVFTSDVLGSNDGVYHSEFDQIALNEDNITGMEITFAHEFGHHVSLGEEGNFSLNQFQDKIDRSNTLRAWRDAVNESSTIQGLRERHAKTKDPYDEYLLDDREIFARTYAQYIATRSGDKTLIAELEKNRSNNPNFAWQDDEFTPIAKALDEHFHTNKNTSFAIKTTGGE